MDTFYKIKKAREILNIGDKASINEIRENYLNLLKKYHPDGKDANKEFHTDMTRKIIDAYNLIMDYCYNYEISFDEKSIEKYLKDEEWWKSRFGNAPMWHTKGNE